MALFLFFVFEKSAKVALFYNISINSNRLFSPSASESTIVSVSVLSIDKSSSVRKTSESLYATAFMSKSLSLLAELFMIPIIALFKEQLLALEQCVDTCPIEIEFCRYFKDFLSEVLPAFDKNSQLLLAHPDKEENFSKFIDEEKETYLFMGPEGGFTDYEVNSLKSAGAKQLSLGCRILRTEFAFTALAGRFLR